MRELFSLYGPFAIQSFGLCIVIGILLFTVLFLRDPRRKTLISTERYYNLLSSSILIGFIGGRLLYATTSEEPIQPFWYIFAFWEGGYSLLGGILALILFVPWYLKTHKIPILPLLDLISTYAPLLQAVSRIGCFFAGCCYGTPLPGFWKLHPTQLYSAGLLLLIFLFLYFLGQRLFAKPGQIICVYLILMSIERFAVDFWRGDREFITLSSFFSVVQLIALILIATGVYGFIYFTFFGKTRKKS